MLYYTTWLISKLDQFNYICEKPYLLSKITRWQVLLEEYNIVFMSRKSIKGSIIVDHLADYAMEDYEPLDFDLPNEGVLVIKDEVRASKWWTLYFDGAVNVSGNGVGEVIISLDGKQYPFSIRL